MRSSRAEQNIRRRPGNARIDEDLRARITCSASSPTRWRTPQQKKIARGRSPRRSCRHSSLRRTTAICISFRLGSPPLATYPLTFKDQSNPRATTPPPRIKAARKRPSCRRQIRDALVTQIPHVPRLPPNRLLRFLQESVCVAAEGWATGGESDGLDDEGVGSLVDNGGKEEEGAGEGEGEETGCWGDGGG